MAQRNPDSVPGAWYVDDACINCGASRDVAPGLIVEHRDKSVFLRQPLNLDEEIAAWRALLVCPTASVRIEGRRERPGGLFPQELGPGVFRCGFNSPASFGAHSYFITRDQGNLLIDSPRFAGEVWQFMESHGGLSDILLSHQDDVADAGRYAKKFGARVWIHEADAKAAPYASNLITGQSEVQIHEGVIAIPVPGHTRGSVVYLLDNQYLFTGDSMAWSDRRSALVAFRDACWYSWEELTKSLQSLSMYRFEWVLPGHGGAVRLNADEMQRKLSDLVTRMQRKR